MDLAEQLIYPGSAALSIAERFLSVYFGCQEVGTDVTSLTAKQLSQQAGGAVQLTCGGDIMRGV